MNNASPSPLYDTVAALRPQYDGDWPEHNFKNTLKAFITAHQLRRVMEIGGGRAPLFSSAEIAELGLEYTVGDIDADELARAPEGVHKQCFDIAGTALPTQQYDLLFSRKVFEHIKDAPAAYRNVSSLLVPGGLVINFIPTLYAPPLLLNYLLPEELSARLLRFFQPHRNPEGQPKFPSYYRLCRALPRTAARLKSLGFKDIALIPFYGHHYFDRVPVLGRLHRVIAALCRRYDVRVLASKAYVILQK